MTKSITFASRYTTTLPPVRTVPVLPQRSHQIARELLEVAEKFDAIVRARMQTEHRPFNIETPPNWDPEDVVISRSFHLASYRFALSPISPETVESLKPSSLCHVQASFQEKTFIQHIYQVMRLAKWDIAHELTPPSPFAVFEQRTLIEAEYHFSFSPSTFPAQLLGGLFFEETAQSRATGLTERPAKIYSATSAGFGIVTALKIALGESLTSPWPVQRQISPTGEEVLSLG